MQVLRLFDPWRGRLCTCPPKYSLHPYTGCSHFCLYCYATSYIGRRPSTPKDSFVSRLRRDLRRYDPRLVVSMSNSSDPYPPIEARLGLTRDTLRTLGEWGARVLVVTKSSLVTRDTDLLKRMKAAVTITITTLDRRVQRLIEPNAPPPSERLRAVRALSREGVPVGVRIDPIIPRVNDDPDDLRRLVREAVNAGALHVTTSTFKARPDSLRRIKEALGRLGVEVSRVYLEEGVRIGGYVYLREEERRSLLSPVVEEASAQGVTYATCREGLKSFKKFFSSPSCDGSHLIPGSDES